MTWAPPATTGLPTIFPSYGAVGFFTDRFIAVGSSSAIVESLDGLTWTEALDGQGNRIYAPTTGADLNEVTVGAGNRYVAVGERGAVLTSDNGSTWTTRVVMTTSDQELRAVTWDGGQFLAVGAGGRMTTSPDGVVWSERTALLNTNRNIVEAHWDASHSRYLVAGSTAASNSFTGGFIKYSALNSLASWTDVSSGTATAIINGVTALDASQGNAFVAVGSSGLVLRSSDGNAWSLPTTSPVTATGLTAATSAGASVIAVSDSGQAYASADGGLVWTGPIATTTTNSLNAIATDGAGTFVAVGNTGTVVISADSGATWSAAASVPSTGINLTGVAWSPTLALYVATGNSTVNTVEKGTFWSSPDGQIWTAVDPPLVITALAPDNELYAVSWIDSRFIAVGKYGLIMYSTDGANWTGGNAVEIAGSLYGIAWDGTNIVVAGAVSAGVTPTTSPATIAIYMSGDGGSTWTGHEKLGAETLFGVAWNGAQYVAGGQNGLLLASGGLDAAVNPLLNASVDTIGRSCNTSYVSQVIRGTAKPLNIPTCLPNAYPSSYKLTVTNNSNLDVPADAVQLAANFAPGSQFIWGGATITVNNTTQAISCDALTNQLRPVCTIPVALSVFPLPKGSAQTNRPKEGVDVTIALQPTAIGDLTIDFEVLTPGVAMSDQNTVNNILHTAATVLPQQEIICSPDVFLSGCVSNVTGGSGSGSGGGAFGWWSLLLALFAGVLRRLKAAPGV